MPAIHYTRLVRHPTRSLRHTHVHLRVGRYWWHASLKVHQIGLGSLVPLTVSPGHVVLEITSGGYLGMTIVGHNE
jgi:hypothetical protein